MNFWDVAVLSVIQGIAEFLPVSSSGHLVLAGHWLGIEEANGTLNIMLHAGTLFSILVFYFQRILRLLHEDRRVIVLLIVGTLPGALLGFLVKKYSAQSLENPWLASWMLIVTGGILLASRRITRENPIDYQQSSWVTALMIGMAQAFAILPGVSRSGSTIFMGLLLGLKREAAGTFSFLMAIPIIAGATAYEIFTLSGEGAGPAHSPWLLSIGVLLSFGVGYVSLCWLVSFIQKGRFHLFAWWCIPFGILSLLLLFFQQP
ncbi:MAG: undecaprenyl-diphosphate phosphatase [Planctomycetota bacterium]|nr:undecaprenyl-diphosphate phosphatase [Planctomycetota bacterium]